MKKTLLALLLAASFSTHADERCTIYGQLAEVTMRGRQAGMTLEAMMEFSREKQPNSAIGDTHRAMILDAYEQPRYQGETMQQRAIAEFANKRLVACYRALQKKS